MSDLIDPPVAETKEEDEEAVPVPLGVASEETRGAWIGCGSDNFFGYIRC